MKSASGLPGFKPEGCSAPGASVADVRMRASRSPGLSLICLGKRPSWLAFPGSRGSPSLGEWHCLGRRGLALARAVLSQGRVSLESV